MAGSEVELSALLGSSPVENGIPEFAADALTTNCGVGDEVF